MNEATRTSDKSATEMSQAGDIVPTWNLKERLSEFELYVTIYTYQTIEKSGEEK